MGQPTKVSLHHSAMLSSSSLHWDGKCRNCRKLMSSCICFQESDSDADPLHTSTSNVRADASETRPLWNALRKMHRNSTTTQLVVVQPPTSLHQSSVSSQNDRSCRRSEALPPLRAQASVTHSTSNPRHHVYRRSDAQSPQNCRRDTRESRQESSFGLSSLHYKDGIQRGSIINNSYKLKRDVKDVGVMRSMQSRYKIEKHKAVSMSHSKEKFSYGPEEGCTLSDENDGTVWEL
ncbi:unnamed protein product [Peronospora belbahrii]|uniref:Uncharacterized protein n=1 Tax=Peronospora belbahrii TaxID=622444 RepID=A0AAU9KQR4_9STRA|nr:unnamed protein product [Peronospora belbahrii]CAH0516361.1 unnamed protein product [Peronospora belbahrii]